MPYAAPRCSSCNRRHLPTLPCWRGEYVTRLGRLVRQIKGDRCWRCHRLGADTTDHVLPRAMGGTDGMDNLEPAHGLCNMTGYVAPAPALPVETSRRW